MVEKKRNQEAPGEQTPRLPPMVSIASGHENEQQLENEPVYRFHYAAEVIGFGQEDRDLISLHQKTTDSCLDRIVDSIYERMFEYLPMKKHFVTRHHGFYGHAPESLDEVTSEQEQTLFRKMKLKEYFEKLSRSEHNETLAVLLDVIGRIHTPHLGNPLVSIPLVQLTSLLGFMCDQFMLEISQLAELDIQTRIQLQRAYSKLFWVQNNMFLRHHNR